MDLDRRKSDIVLEPGFHSSGRPAQNQLLVGRQRRQHGAGEDALDLHRIDAPKTQAIPVGEVVNTGGINYATHSFQLKLEASENIVGVDRIEVKIDKDAEFHPYIEALRFQSS